MNSNNAILSVLIVGLLVLGLIFYFKNNQVDFLGLNNQAVPTITPPPKTASTVTPGISIGSIRNGAITLPMTPSDNQYGQTGTAMFGLQTGKIKITLNMDKTAGIDNSQPALIHAGNCENLKQIIFPLNNVVNGKSETILNTNINNIVLQLPLAINVYKSTQEMDVSTACLSVSR